MKSLLLGYDIGSSSVKVSIIESDSGKLLATASSPDSELEILSPKPGWAEQDPATWWKHAIAATQKVLAKSGANPAAVLGIGISYQMHGLVLVDKNQEVLRPAIIWCDSRAVQIGEDAYHQLGELYCMKRLLNSPGNFTASKLKWVKDNEPDTYNRVYKAMLPGDYLAMRMTGEITTTISGLSEGIMWDYEKQTLPERLFDFYGIPQHMVATVVPTFSNQGKLTAQAAEILGLKTGTPISYRAGDQPNNAFSLNTLHPGEIAATAGTSGVIYGITDQPMGDKLSRVNTFVHVNHQQEKQRLGVLLCVNGTGIMNSWLRRAIGGKDQMRSYEEMNALAASAPVGSDQLTVLPFGNGAERVLQNANIGASFHGLELSRHHPAHMCRAVQEGIVFALGYGFDVLNQLGIQSKVIRAGNANMFLSEVFCKTFAQITGAELSLYNTDGSQGAARGAGVGIGHYASVEEAFGNLTRIKQYEPDKQLDGAYQEAYARWKTILEGQLNSR
jgi:xylulokinase